MKCKISPYLVFTLSVVIYFGFWREVVTAVFLACCHEFGHYCMLKLLHTPVQSIHFGLQGAVMVTSPLSYTAEFFSAAAGPMVNILLLFFLPSGCPASMLDLWLLFYNLMPIYPLDGGRLLRALLLRHNAPTDVHRWMICVEIAVCSIAVIVSVYLTIRLQMGRLPMIPSIFLVAECLILAKDHPP